MCDGCRSWIRNRLLNALILHGRCFGLFVVLGHELLGYEDDHECEGERQQHASAHIFILIGIAKFVQLVVFLKLKAISPDRIRPIQRDGNAAICGLPWLRREAIQNARPPLQRTLNRLAHTCIEHARAATTNAYKTQAFSPWLRLWSSLRHSRSAAGPVLRSASGSFAFCCTTSNVRWISSSNFVNSALMTAFFGLITKSTGSSNIARCNRTAFLIRRLIRTRSTAFPSTRPTVIPILGPSLTFSALTSELLACRNR